MCSTGVVVGYGVPSMVSSTGGGWTKIPGPQGQGKARSVSGSRRVPVARVGASGLTEKGGGLDRLTAGGADRVQTRRRRPF